MKLTRLKVQRFLSLLLVFFTEVNSLEVVFVSRGEDAVLSCPLKRKGLKPSEKVTVTWAAGSSVAEPFLKCEFEATSDPRSCSEPRYSLFADSENGLASLLIRETKLSDNGLYFCHIQKGKLRSGMVKQRIDLKVEAQPQILSLLVMNEPCGSHSAPRRLQCEAEGHPRPKLVVLTATRRMLEGRIHTLASQLYRRTICIPYEETEVFTCRAENILGHAERTLPGTNYALTIGLAAGGVVIFLLIAGISCYCLRRNPQRAATSNQADADPSVVYSAVTVFTSSSALPMNRPSEDQQETAVLYSTVNVPHV